MHHIFVLALYLFKAVVDKHRDIAALAFNSFQSIVLQVVVTA